MTEVLGAIERWHQPGCSRERKWGQVTRTLRVKWSLSRLREGLWQGYVGADVSLARSCIPCPGLLSALALLSVHATVTYRNTAKDLKTPASSGLAKIVATSV